jgi:cyclopropane fatty-acyl-phospholipid synthase-like methyltransferase
VGRTVVDLGCAFGSLVRYLRSLGADAYGVDLSYPISQGIALWPELAPYLIVADVRVWLPLQSNNAYDAIISRGFLNCLTDAELATLIPEMNRVAKRQQVHSVDNDCDPLYYNHKSLPDWEALGWESGTVIVDTAN